MNRVWIHSGQKSTAEGHAVVDSCTWPLGGRDSRTSSRVITVMEEHLRWQQGVSWERGCQRKCQRGRFKMEPSVRPLRSVPSVPAMERPLTFSLCRNGDSVFAEGGFGSGWISKHWFYWNIFYLLLFYFHLFFISFLLELFNLFIKSCCR